MGTYFTYWEGKMKKKTVKENVQKNDNLVNMESILLLAFVNPERH